MLSTLSCMALVLLQSPSSNAELLSQLVEVGDAANP
jgi:hypothetical protein